jgi:tRNA (guanine-N7-)-methyltransferase
MIFQRHIRSFVRREGRMTVAQKMAFEKFWPLYGLSLDALPIPKTACKLIVEIGFGMGHSLLAMAEQFSNDQFLGIDIYKPGIGAMLQAIHNKNLQNIRLVNEDAIDVLQKLVDHSIDALLIFFPDPWPKTRHHKRRLIQSSFIQCVISKLKVGGYLHIATDWEDYAIHIEAVLNEFPDLVNREKEEVMPRALTKFEQRGRRLGHEVYEFVRRLV